MKTKLLETKNEYDTKQQANENTKSSTSRNSMQLLIYIDE